jgi:hypothetical protein
VSPVLRFDHVVITVADLDTVAAFFGGMGFEQCGLRRGRPRTHGGPAGRRRLPVGGGVSEYEGEWRMAQGALSLRCIPSLRPAHILLLLAFLTKFLFFD